MCESQQKKELMDKITSAVDTYREFDIPDEDIIDKIINRFNVTREYVLELLEPKKA